MLTRRRAALVAASVACFIIALVLLLIIGLPNLPLPGLWKGLALAVGMFPAAVLLPLWNWRMRGLRAAVARTGGRMCPACGYDVAALPPSGVCPECGGAYDIARDAPLWNRFAELGMRRPSAPRT